MVTLYFTHYKCLSCDMLSEMLVLLLCILAADPPGVSLTQGHLRNASLTLNLSSATLSKSEFGWILLQNSVAR